MSARHAYKRWLIHTVSFIVATLFCLSLVNLLIDPSGIFSLVDINRLNSEKPEMIAGGGRRTKSAALAFNRYDLVILGTSRCEVGMNPEAKIIQEKKVYNAGLPGLTPEETIGAIDLIRKRNSAEEILVEIGFLGFHGDRRRRSSISDFDESLFNPQNSVIPFFAKYLLSGSTIKSSAVTVIFNASGRKSPFLRSGLVLKKDPPNLKKSFSQALSQDFSAIQRDYTSYFDNKATMRSFGEAISKCRDQGLKVVIFIPPRHATHLEALRIVGLYETFEQWKRDLVSTMDKIDPSHERIRLFDFADYSKYTTEPIPERKHRKMKWHWEAGHFKRELGDMILQAIYNPQGKDEAFGALLHEKMLSRHLNEIRERQSNYINNHPKDVRLVERISKDPDAWQKKKKARKA